MAERITIDVGDAPAKPTAFEALEKIGRLAVKMQEQDAKFQRLAQHLTVPDTSFKVDTDSIYRSIAEYKVDPIIPEGYFERTQEYQQKSLEVLQSILPSLSKKSLTRCRRFVSSGIGEQQRARVVPFRVWYSVLIANRSSTIPPPTTLKSDRTSSSAPPTEPTRTSVAVTTFVP